MKVELYLNSEKGRILGGDPYMETSAGRYRSRMRTDTSSCRMVKKTFIGFSKKEKEIRDRLERMLTQYNVELIVYDVKQTTHAFRAWYKGVRDTPTIIIGKHRFGEDFKENEIRGVLEEN